MSDILDILDSDGQLDDSFDPQADFEAELQRARFTYVRPNLYPKQKAAIFAPERYSWIEATTKAGKTAGCIVWLGEQAFAGSTGRNYWWVAPIFPQAKIAFTRMVAALPEHLRTFNLTELRIDLANGTHIWFKSGDKPDGLYGEDVYAAVIDEASRMKEEAFIAIRSTLTATQGPIRIIGNVKGRKNWFYRGARKAEAGLPGHSYHKITALDSVAAGVLSAGEIEDARQVLPDSAFKMLYMAEPADDEGNPFGMDAIRECQVDKQSLNPTKALGQDLAKSVDFAVTVGLDSNCHQTFFDRWQGSWRSSKARIADNCRGRATLVDSTGVGDPILEDLQALPNGNYEGYQFTSSSRQRLLENLAVELQKRRVRYVDKVTRDELESFEFTVSAEGRIKWAAPEGSHDDCVMALALAVWHLGKQGGAFIAEGPSGKQYGSERERIENARDQNATPPADEMFQRSATGWENQTGLM